MKDRTALIITIIAILILSSVSYRQSKYLQDLFSQKEGQISLPQLEVPKFEMPDFEIPDLEDMPGIEDIIPQEDKTPVEFVSPDNKLKFTYSSDWIETESGLLEKFNEKVAEQASKTLFLAQKLNVREGVFVFLIVQEFSLTEQESAQSIVEDIEEEASRRKETMTILESDIREKEAFLESKHEQEGSALHSVRKLMISEKTAYLVTIVSQEESWSLFQEEANDILDSVSLVE
jgi:hypothetical protein